MTATTTTDLTLDVDDDEGVEQIVLKGKDTVQRHAISALETVHAVLRFPGFWKEAAQDPDNYESLARGKRGRPSAHPPWVYQMILQFAYEYGRGQRQAVLEVRGRHTWNKLIQIAHQALPEGFREADPNPPTLQMHKHHMRKLAFAKYETIVEDSKLALTQNACDIAESRGHFDPDQPLQFKKPSFLQAATADGVVFATTCSDTKLQDPDCGIYIQGGDSKNTMDGSKFVVVESVSDYSLGGLILAIEHVTPGEGKTQGNEAATTVDVLTRLKGTIPGLRLVTIDGVLHGKHIRPLHDHDIYVVNKTAAKSKEPVRREHVNFLQTITDETYGCKHRLVLNGSQPCQEVLNYEGNYEPQPLKATKLTRRKNVDGTRASYVSYLVPCENGDHVYQHRIDRHGQDEPDTFNRAERARLYPAGSKAFETIYSWRERSESMHAKIKRRMKKIPAIGKQRQTMFLLAAQLAANAESEHMWHFHMQLDDS